MVWTQYSFSRNHTSDFEFRSFPGLVLCGQIPSRDAEQGSESQLPGGPATTRVNSQHTDRRSVPTPPFCFWLSAQYSINDMRESMLHYKIGFVLDDVAQQ